MDKRTKTNKQKRLMAIFLVFLG